MRDRRIAIGGIKGIHVIETGEKNLELALHLVMQRVSTTLEATGRSFPLYADNDAASNPTWVTTVDGNWCAGYWIGLLWLAAKHSASVEARRRYETAAYDHIAAMSSQRTNHLFAGLNHHYAGFMGFDIVGDPELRDLGLKGADAMLDLFNCKAQQIPIGCYSTTPSFSSVLQERMPRDRSHVVAVDAVHTSLPILWRSHAETNRPEFRKVALAHTQRHVEWHIRPDGSTTQMTSFDPQSGARQKDFSPLAHSNRGCWSRGLAWSVAGLAQAYVSSGDQIALGGIRRSVSYFLGHVGNDLVPVWDLDLPESTANRDSSAAAILAYGLILLRGRSGPETNDLERLGARILASLVDRYLVWEPSAGNTGGVLHGCYRYPERVAVDNELIWSDFYVAAALDLATSHPREYGSV